MYERNMAANDLFIALEERAQLVRFCAAMTKNNDAAEDLAQETLLIAWRKSHTLRDAERYQAWLLGIARNVCLRWLRAHGRDCAQLVPFHADRDEAPGDLDDIVADELDIELVLERKELAELLDRALALLPSQTRTALLRHYVEESSLGEIAAQLGTNASAIAMRLQRGKLVLRRILTQEMMLYSDQPASDWEVTPLWCSCCGQRRLLGQRDPNEGKFFLKCPLCSPDEILSKNHLSVLKGIRGYKPLRSRLAAWGDHNYRLGLRTGSAKCPGCGRTVPALIQTPGEFPSWLQGSKEMQTWMRYLDDRFITMPCEHCVSSCVTSLEPLILEAQAGQQFLKRYPRIRTLPRQYIEADGRAAILTRFESVTNTATLDVVSDYQTYEILHVYGGTL